jgi:eukaryotic-like serine/threonine-protein kinase
MIMMTSRDCPPSLTWAEWLRGNLNDADSHQYEAHLPDCPTCRSTVDNLTDDRSLRGWTDPLSGRVPRSPYFDPPHESGMIGRLGNFDIIEEVGQGGMGVVYRAVDRTLRRAVALKVLRVGREDHRSIERFLREARAAARVVHDHLVPVLSVERAANGLPVLVLPFIAGSTLKQRIATDRVVPMARAVAIARTLAAALAALHEAGLIHRDIKPSNILLDSLDGRAKLGDFGLVREAISNSSGDGSLVGTLEYMSPEQMTAGAVVDARSDLYSLGVTLYEMLTGTTPFRGTAAEIIARTATEDPLPPSTFVPSIPRDLDTIVLTALAKEPARRFASARDFDADLDRFIHGKPIHARRASWLERGRKWARRHPGPAIAAATIAALMIGLTVATIRLRSALIATQTAEATAQTARTESETARRRSDETFNFFVRDLLTQSDLSRAERGSDPNLTVRALLDQASHRLRTAHLEPNLEADLSFNIGQSYLNLGLAVEARGHLDRALNQLNTHLPAHSPERFMAENAAITAQFRSGEIEPALARFAESLAAQEAHLGRFHAVTMTARHNYGNALGDAGRFDQAIALHQLNWEHRCATLGESARETLENANALGVAYSQARRHTAARDVLARVVELQTERHGPRHQNTMTSVGNLAMTYIDMKQHAEAIPLLERSRAYFLEYFGVDNPRTLLVTNHLAYALANAGRLPEALGLSKDTLDRAIARMGPDHLDTILIRNNYATCLFMGVRREDALPFFAENCQHCDRRLTARHPKSIIAWHNYANILRLAGKPEEAVRVWDDHVLPVARAVYGDRDITFIAGKNCARTLDKLGRSDDAIRRFQDIVARERAAKLPIADTLDELGEYLVREQRHADAEPVLRESLGLQRATPTPSWEPLRTQIRWGTCLAELNRPEESMAAILPALEAIEASKSIPDNWRSILLSEGVNAIWPFTLDDTVRTRWAKYQNKKGSE